jgi:flagellar basal body-associated protein FliL
MAALAYASQSARRRNIALAIVGLFLLAVVFAIARATIYPERRTSSIGTARSPAAALDPSQPAEPVVQAVNAFSAFTLEQSATRGADANDTYASDGLRLLATVVDALIVRDSLVRDIHATALQQMRAEADRLERSAGSTHAMTTTRAAFISAAAAVTVVQRRKYPHLEQATTRLREAARSIRLNRPLRQQSAEVEAFFQRASDAVQGMAAVEL